ncbi:MAG: hypothetical protein IJU72_07795, partial [Bacteroidales bacterium]|nr:hypothetical protein [Bacteroidales bacterium]
HLYLCLPPTTPFLVYRALLHFGQSMVITILVQAAKIHIIFYIRLTIPDKILPAMSRFGGGNRSYKKTSVIKRLKEFFEKYLGL